MPMEQPAELGEQVQKSPPIRIVLEDIAPGVPPGPDGEERAGEGDAKRPCHSGDLHGVDLRNVWHPNPAQRCQPGPATAVSDRLHWGVFEI
jgi:hypothetical protein